MGWMLAAASVEPTLPTGGKSSKCRMRHFSALFRAAKRERNASLSLAQRLADSVGHPAPAQSAGRGAAEPLPGDPNSQRSFLWKGGVLALPHGERRRRFIGSDLSGYTGARSADNLRTAITDPDKNLDLANDP